MRQLAAVVATALCALATPAWAAGATATVPGTKLSLPASARVTGTSAATATSTATAPSGAQPGTVAPGSTTPITSAPATTAPATTTPGTPSTSTTPGTLPTGPAATAPTSAAPGLPRTLGASRRRPRKSHKGLSELDYALAGIGALLLLACLIWALVRWLALEPRWSAATVYSLREASNRASATWAEFSDWARIGH